MSAKYALQFGLMSVAAVAAAVASPGGAEWSVLLGWVAVAFGAVAIAYGSGRPQMLMKRADGSQPVVAWVVLGPYFLLARLSLGLYRLTHRRGRAVAEVSPGLWFSRRLTGREARAAGVRWAGVLDLAAEFPRAPVEAGGYRSMPLLDGAVPGESQLREAADWIEGQLPRGPVLVHCALGHGRTGSVVIAWLLLHGGESTVEAGVGRLRTLRDGFGLSAGQLRRVEDLAAEVGGGAER